MPSYIYRRSRPLRSAEENRLRYCQRFGHEWPPLKEANPGDEHWCGFCGTRRTIGTDGSVNYQYEWE